MLLKDICTTDVVFCGRETTLQQVAHLMRDKHIGDVIVVDDPEGARTPAGLITDRDIVVKVLGADLDHRDVTAGQIMRTPAITASETEDSSVAIARMRTHGVRRLPVTGAGSQLAGIVTLDDLLRQVIEDAASLLRIIAKEQDVEHRTVR